MELEKCNACEGAGYYEVSTYDPVQSCEECNGYGVVIKKLTIEELKAQFEENRFNVSLDFNKDGNEEYLCYTTFERWNGYFICAKANNILREEG